MVELVCPGRRLRINAWVDQDRCELKEFLACLKTSSYAKWKRVCALIKRIGDKGPLENEEQFRLIENGLYKLMTHDGICVVWFYAGMDSIVCTHAFFVRNGDVDKEIGRAKLIQKSYMEGESDESVEATRNAAVFRSNV